MKFSQKNFENWRFWKMSFAILKNSDFGFFFQKKRENFAWSPWKSVKGSWISRTGRNFYDYPGSQPKITHPKHFSRQYSNKVIIHLYLFSTFQSKFLSFYQFVKIFNSDNFDYDSLQSSDYVYMRWKEHFLVPDHTIRDIQGASFAGFYYICFQKSTASIEGYYYHRNSEW